MTEAPAVLKRSKKPAFLSFARNLFRKFQNHNFRKSVLTRQRHNKSPSTGENCIWFSSILNSHKYLHSEINGALNPPLNYLKNPSARALFEINRVSFLKARSIRLRSIK